MKNNHTVAPIEISSGFIQAILVSVICSGSAMAATAPILGAASSFAVLGATTVTNLGASVLDGDLGCSPGASITGFPPGTVNIGYLHANDAIAMQAKTDASSAYNALLAQSCTSGPLGATDLAGQTLVPGVYCYTSTLQNSGLLTLDAQGNANAVWIFQIASTLTTMTGASQAFVNGGYSSNVYWQVGSSATLGLSSSLTGSILAYTSITLNSGASVSGRALALTGAVTLDSNIVSLAPLISLAKSVSVASDPVNGLSNPKAIPGAELTYTLLVSNKGYGNVVADSTVVTDPIPAYMTLCVSALCSNPPVLFFCNSCGLSYTYATDVSYSSQIGGGAPYTHVAVADAAGYDPNITGIKINPSGAFYGQSGGVQHNFSLALKMKIK